MRTVKTILLFHFTIIGIQKSIHGVLINLKEVKLRSNLNGIRIYLQQSPQFIIYTCLK